MQTPANVHVLVLLYVTQKSQAKPLEAEDPQRSTRNMISPAYVRIESDATGKVGGFDHVALFECGTARQNQESDSLLCAHNTVRLLVRESLERNAITNRMMMARRLWAICRHRHFASRPPWSLPLETVQMHVIS